MPETPAKPKAPRPDRDNVTTIREDGSRFFLHPADTRGLWLTLRRSSAWVLIIFYLALPWIPVGGHPAVFLDVAGRRFHLFGATLAFQDAWLLFFLITGLGFSLYFVTALLGRVWCGWACPQTVFLEHVYRRIERLIEGDAVARRRLDQAPWTPIKALRRGGKQLVFVAVSAVITHLFLAYFVSLPQLWKMMHEAPAENWSAFVFTGIFTAVIYFNFAWFREQLCLIICPYGRLQSALVDDHTLAIGYDATRGEPRGKPGVPEVGACVDCNRCVQVCPTGIDIRQGLQIECIACAACVDACDEVMIRLKRPTGLVRYDSQAGFAGGRTRWLRPRIVIYAVLLAVGASVAAWAFLGVRPANFGITRMTGAPYIVEEHSIRNQYLVRLVNKRDQAVRVFLTLEAGAVPVTLVGMEGAVEIGPLAETVRPLIVQTPRHGFPGTFPLHITARDESGAFALVRDIEFVGPDHESEEKKERKSH